MAQVERARENERANKRERQRGARQSRRMSTAPRELTSQDWAWIIALAEAFMAQEGALRIGRTRDGGALALGCYLGEDYATEYIRPSEDLAQAADEIARAWLGDGAVEFDRAYNRLVGKE